MGVCVSKHKSDLRDKSGGGLMDKAVFPQEKMMYEKEKETKGYEGETMVYAFKEAEWKQERKSLREEVQRLRKMVEDREDKIRGMEEKNQKEWELLGTSLLVEQMREERARRDEAAEKWKQLYLEIKMELDDLIQRTYRGDVQYWIAAEEDMIEEVKKELVAKEDTIKGLKAQIASMEQEDYKKEREIDILRQSLRIMSSKKTSYRITKILP